MQLSDKIKKFSVEQAIDYLNKNPVKNLPKLLDWADTFCAGKFEGQRRAIRKACLDPTDAHYPMVQHILNDIDPAVLKTTLVNFFIYGNIIGCERQDQLRAQYQCNIPWAILMDPTSACNLHCTGCWAAEYGNKLNLSLDELDDIIRQGRDMGVYFYIYTGGEPLRAANRLCAKRTSSRSASGTRTASFSASRTARSSTRRLPTRCCA